MSHRASRGMTLIEVLIALAIIGIALTAVIKATSQNIRGTGYLQNKTIALWVGQEIMSEVQLGILNVADKRDKEATKIIMLGQEWFWQASEEASANVRIKKILVKVYAHEPGDDESPLIDLDGYRYHEQ
jgi:general secretion pathway protein I